MSQKSQWSAGAGAVVFIGGAVTAAVLFLLFTWTVPTGDPPEPVAQPEKAPAKGQSRHQVAPTRSAPELDPQRPGAPAPVVASAPEDLAERARGLTGSALMATVAALDARSPEPAWLWQAAARLALEPELATTLGQVARRPHVHLRAREVALDLLAHVGHEPAQRALIAALQDPELRAHAGVDYVGLAQRAGFVDHPTEALVGLVQGLRLDADPEVALAAHYTAGSVAHHLSASGRVQATAGLLDPLRTAALADDPRVAAAAVAGLGNAGLPEDLERILTASAHEAPIVRRQAATALRAWPVPHARARLVTLAGDPASMVQQAALDSLRRAPVTAAEAHRLRAQVESGEAARLHDGLRVTTLSHAEAPGAARAALRSVLARTDDDPRLRARIRRMLNR